MADRMFKRRSWEIIKSVAVTEKETVLTPAVGGGKIDIRHDSPVVLYGKSASFIHAAEGAFIMGTAGCDL